MADQRASDSKNTYVGAESPTARLAHHLSADSVHHDLFGHHSNQLIVARQPTGRRLSIPCSRTFMHVGTLVKHALVGHTAYPCVPFL